MCLYVVSLIFVGLLSCLLLVQAAQPSQQQLQPHESLSSSWQLPPSSPATSATHRWLLSVHLLDGLSRARLPLVGVSVLSHARLQSCRPSLNPLLLPPSMRLPPPHAMTSTYAQLECLQVHRDNALLTSNSVGLAPVELRVPSAHLSSADSSSLLAASTRSLHFHLLHQCPNYTPTDWMWMSIVHGSAQMEQQDSEWDPQGLTVLLINSPQLPYYSAKYETRQVVWPFQTEGQLRQQGRKASFVAH